MTKNYPNTIEDIFSLKKRVIVNSWVMFIGKLHNYIKSIFRRHIFTSYLTFFFFFNRSFRVSNLKLSCGLDSWNAFNILRFQFVCSFFFFLNQRLLHYSWDMNNVIRQMNSIQPMNNNFFIIFLLFSVFSKISCIQTDPNLGLHLNIHHFLILPT